MNKGGNNYCTNVKIYCLSGLGADKRVYQFLNLPGFELEHIEWVTPQPDERLEDYAKRLAEKIDVSEPFHLMGLSFGGMLAIEIAKIKKPQKLIVLSSILGKHEVPTLHRFAADIKLHKIVPANLLKAPNIFTYMAFGLETKESKELLKQILNDTDPDFFVWALSAIAGWENEEILHCIRIHGTRDRILPVDTRTVEHVIDGGGHFAIVDRADEISHVLLESLSGHT